MGQGCRSCHSPPNNSVYLAAASTDAPPAPSALLGQAPPPDNPLTRGAHAPTSPRCMQPKHVRQDSRSFFHALFHKDESAEAYGLANTAPSPASGVPLRMPALARVL